jgi:hypothetical protein
MNSWSSKNKFVLSGMVKYLPTKDRRTTVQENL